MAQRLRGAADRASRTRDEAPPDEDEAPDTAGGTGSAAVPDGTGADAAESRRVSLNGETVEIDPETTVSDLRETSGIGSEAVFTYRSPGGIEALTDDDVVADHVADGGEIQTQPIADSEVFGAR
jgi:hypothetical protein